MIKAVVFDKDGSIYSLSRYLTPFAEHLSRHFGSEFMETYHELKEMAKIGGKYGAETLCEQEDGKLLNSAFSIPSLAALHYGFKGTFEEEFRSFYSCILDDPSFPHDNIVMEILGNPSCRKAVVTNDSDDLLLRRLNMYDLFDMKYFNARKDENLEKICDGIENSFSAEPSEILWVEDDLEIIERLKSRGYNTVLRKTEGFNYVPEAELSRIADMILEDDLTQVYDILNNDNKQE